MFGEMKITCWARLSRGWRESDMNCQVVQTARYLYLINNKGIRDAANVSKTILRSWSSWHPWLLEKSIHLQDTSRFRHESYLSRIPSRKRRVFLCIVYLRYSISRILSSAAEVVARTKGEVLAYSPGKGPGPLRGSPVGFSLNDSFASEVNTGN